MKDAIFKRKKKNVYYCMFHHLRKKKYKMNYYRKFAVDHIRFNIDFPSVREREEREKGDKVTGHKVVVMPC